MPGTPAVKKPALKKPIKTVASGKVAAKKSTVRKTTIARAEDGPKPIAEAIDSKPSLRFYPTDELRLRVVALLDKIEHSADATSHRTKLAESVNELTSAGMNYYFVRVLKEAKVGFVTQQSASLGLAGVQQVMAPVIRNIIGRLEHTQLQALAHSMRLMIK